MNHKAFTLVELVISIVIIAISVTGVLLVFQTVTKRSADPMITQQAIAIAKSYLEEIIAQPFPASVPCQAPPGGGRAYFSQICDYANLTDNGAHDQNGISIAGLDSYNISVNVDTNGASLQGLIAGSQVVRVDVTVMHPRLSQGITISGYRTNY